jgi:hypothetical protein
MGQNAGKEYDESVMTNILKAAMAVDVRHINCGLCDVRHINKIQFPN